MTCVYPFASECPIIVYRKQVLQAIKRPRADKAPSPDGVTNGVLQERGGNSKHC